MNKKQNGGGKHFRHKYLFHFDLANVLHAVLCATEPNLFLGKTIVE